MSYELGEYSDDPDSWLPFDPSSLEISAEDDRVSLSSAEDDSPYTCEFFAGPFETLCAQVDLTVASVDSHTGDVELRGVVPFPCAADVRRIRLKSFWTLAQFPLSANAWYHRQGSLTLHRDGIALTLSRTGTSSRRIVTHLVVRAPAHVLRLPLEPAHPYGGVVDDGI